MTVKNDFSVPYRSIFRETPGREIRSNQKIVLNRYFVLSHRRVSAKPPLAQTRVHRISSRTPLTERFEPPPRPTDGPPAVPKGPRSAGRSGLHRFRLNKVQPTSTLNQNWRELIFANPRADPTLAGRFGRFRPAPRAGPLRHRWGLARRADPARADPGLAEGRQALDKNELFLYSRLRIEKPPPPSTRSFARTLAAARKQRAPSSRKTGETVAFCP